MDDKLIIIKNIINNINLKNFNYKIISKNIKYLTNIFQNFKDIYIKLDKKYIINKLNDNELITIKKYINSFIKNVNSQKLNKIINSYDKIIYLSYENIKFYYIYDNDNKLNKDLQLINFLFNISITLNKFTFKKDTIDRIIIWIPIDSSRNFNSNTINKQNLKNTINNFEAFTVSGITFGNNPRLTIVTRYEEVEKLLIHELIHNYYLDGNIYHDDMDLIIKDYLNIKNNSNSNIKNYNYEYSIYESYTELLSTYFYLLFININLDKKDIFNKLLGQICLEIIYSYNTIANLAILNNYNNYDDFIKNETFFGNICFYEYYYVKGLLYNNFLINIPNNSKEFLELYKNIINVIHNSNKDLLLKDIFNNYCKQNNYKYMLHY
jgi:hypothetical protein